jgi:hypothetical protein
MYLLLTIPPGFVKQLVYTRLETVKVAASELSKSASERKMANPAAIELGLQDPDGNSALYIPGLY